MNTFYYYLQLILLSKHNLKYQMGSCHDHLKLVNVMTHHFAIVVFMGPLRIVFLTLSMTGFIA